MGAFDHFPYTNFHELNLMWILEALKEIQTTTEQFVAINSLKYADPIQWNIVQQYEKNTIVIDPLTGTAYISVQAVPSGVSLSNEDYWTVVFDLGSFVVRAAKNFTSRYEDETTLTATFNTQAGEWLVWGDTLYIANVNITAGDSYVIGGNITQITIEEIKNEIYTTFNTIIGSLDDLTTTDKSNLVAAINEVASEVLGKIGDLDDLTTTDKSNLVAAINEVLQTLIDTCGDLDDLTTTDKSNLVAAINEVDSDLNDLSVVVSNSCYVNVLDFGAVGDGVTDDSAAFQAAIDTGKNVYVPTADGLTFRIENTLNMSTIDQAIFSLPIRNTFQGSGHGCILGIAIPVFNVNKRAVFYGLNIRARNDGTEAFIPDTIGIKINMVDAVGSVDSIVDNCMFYCYAHVISIYGRQCIVSNNMFQSCNNCMTINYDPGSGSDTNLQGATYGGRGIRFLSNRIHHPAYGMVIQSGNIRNAQIIGNIWDIGGSVVRVEQGASFTHSVISNNIIGHSTWTQLAINETSGFQYNIISGNVFEYDPVTVGSYRLISGTDRVITGCVFIGNRISNTTSSLISFAGSNNVSFIGNIFDNCTSTCIQCTSGAFNGIVVIGNSSTAANIMFRAPSASTLTNCVIKGNGGVFATYIDGVYGDGGGNQIENRTTIADINADPTQSDFNSLLSALRKAGVLHS